MLEIYSFQHQQKELQWWWQGWYLCCQWWQWCRRWWQNYSSCILNVRSIFLLRRLNLMILFVFGYRSLENDFLLVEASLLVPCSYVSRNVPYKYIVFKEKRKDSKEKENYLWDHLVNWGVFKNRCLQIPKDRCVPEGVYLFIYFLFFATTSINYVCYFGSF